MAYENTKVMIIGTGEFRDSENLNNIPNIEVNVLELEKVFNNQLFFPGISQVEKVFNSTRANILMKINDFLSKIGPEDNLILYMSGHGVISHRNFQLYFPTVDTDVDHLEDVAIQINQIKQKLKDCAAAAKIFILDCCYSGRALYGTMSSNDIDQSITTNVMGAIQGSFILTSTCQDSPSFYPIDNPTAPTYFTMDFLNCIQQGINNSKGSLEIGDVYKFLKSNPTKGKGPRASALNDAEIIPVGVNTYHPMIKSLLKEIESLKSENLSKNKEINTLSKMIESNPHKDDADDTIMLLNQEIKNYVEMINVQNTKIDQLEQSLESKFKFSIKKNKKTLFVLVPTLLLICIIYTQMAVAMGGSPVGILSCVIYVILVSFLLLWIIGNIKSN